MQHYFQNFVSFGRYKNYFWQDAFAKGEAIIRMKHPFFFVQKRCLLGSAIEMTQLNKSMNYLLISCNTEERIAQNIYIHNSKKTTEELS